MNVALCDLVSVFEAGGHHAMQYPPVCFACCIVFLIPVLAAQAPPDCPRAVQASAAGSACRDVVVPGKYPFSELLDQPPESGFGLACATLLLGLFALRAVLR
jgi:hypothetical protein